MLQMLMEWLVLDYSVVGSLSRRLPPPPPPHPQNVNIKVIILDILEIGSDWFGIQVWIC